MDNHDESEAVFFEVSHPKVDRQAVSKIKLIKI